jgi:phosphatidylethanolamine/phosphatidyl-N-methylethanolamine N-methyltransferase
MPCGGRGGTLPFRTRVFARTPLQRLTRRHVRSMRVGVARLHATTTHREERTSLVSVTAQPSTSTASRRRGTATFLRQALRSQASIGAIAPTSAIVARQMAGLISPDRDLTVVELGAGTGAISAAVGPRLAPRSRHLAVEREPGLLAVLEQVAPWADRVLGDACELGDRLAELDVFQADVVLSSLPWGNFPADLQQRILAQVTRVLARDGVFAAIAYRPTRLAPRSRAFRSTLHETFGEVVTSSTLWANLPPARLYVCRRPLPKAGAAIPGPAA